MSQTRPTIQNPPGFLFLLQLIFNVIDRFVFCAAGILLLLTFSLCVRQPLSVHAAASSQRCLTVRYLDVEQGDSALITCDGESMLVDGGTSAQSSKIYTVLKNQSITKLKYIVATHPEADHVGGLPGALSYASCGAVLSPVTTSDNNAFQKLAKKCAEKNVPIQVPAPGDTYSLGGATIKILGPTDEIPNDANNNSIFFRLDYGTTSFLFTGDAEQMEQQLIMWNEYDDLQADVLKMPHHGSRGGASYAFLDAVNPTYAVISCKAGNSYGHPHQETMDLLQQHGTTVYRTDLQGDIVCTSDGTSITFSVSTKATGDLYAPGSKQSAGKSSGGTTSAKTTGSTSSSFGKIASGSTGAAAVQSSSVQTAGTASQSSSAAETHDYIANKNTGKFHYPSCSSVTKMKESNKLSITAARDQMIANGYSPCGNCHP